MDDFAVRAVGQGALEPCADVLRQAFGTVAAQFGLTSQNCPTNAAFATADRLDADMQNGNLLFGLYQDEKLIGFVQIVKKGPELFELKNLGVLPDHRHLGCGRRLLEFACRLAAQQGGKKLTIGIIEENTVLRSWYQQHGFVHTGTKTFDHLPFTVGFMEKILELSE